jgi:hypothetical protein
MTAISPVHWRADYCLAVSYKHSPYCWVRLREMFISSLPSYTRYSMMSEQIIERNSFRHHSIITGNGDILTVEMGHYYEHRLPEEGSILSNWRFLNWWQLREYHLLVCNASYFFLVPSVTYCSTLEMETLRFSEISANFYRNTRQYILENRTLKPFLTHGIWSLCKRK